MEGAYTLSTNFEKQPASDSIIDQEPVWRESCDFSMINMRYYYFLPELAIRWNSGSR